MMQTLTVQFKKLYIPTLRRVTRNPKEGDLKQQNLKTEVWNNAWISTEVMKPSVRWVWIFSLTMHLQKDIKRTTCIAHITHLLRSKIGKLCTLVIHTFALHFDSQESLIRNSLYSNYYFNTMSSRQVMRSKKTIT